MLNNRITRKSLKQKLIGVASALLITVALIASGFSTWIISSNAKAESKIGVSVATVSTSVMTITVDGLEDGRLKDQSICFEPADYTGRVRAEDGGPTESLTITISGTVTNAQHLGTLLVTLDYTNSNLKQAEQDGYIRLPELTNDQIQLRNLNDGTTPPITDVNEVHNGYILVEQKDGSGNPIIEHGYQVYFAYFEYTMTILWGEKFAFVNPSFYYDGVADIYGNPLTADALTNAFVTTLEGIHAMKSDLIYEQLSEFKQLIMLNNKTDLGFVVSATVK